MTQRVMLLTLLTLSGSFIAASGPREDRFVVRGSCARQQHFSLYVVAGKRCRAVYREPSRLPIHIILLSPGKGAPPGVAIFIG